MPIFFSQTNPKEIEVLRSLVEKMRDRKHGVGPQGGMDDEQSIADSSSDFEIGDDDVCDTDSEWSLCRGLTWSKD